MNSDTQKEGDGEICINAKAFQDISLGVQHRILEETSHVP